MTGSFAGGDAAALAWRAELIADVSRPRLWRPQTVTSRATIVTRKICPVSASSTVSPCGRPTAGERSPKPSVVSVTKLK